MILGQRATGSDGALRRTQGAQGPRSIRSRREARQLFVPRPHHECNWPLGTLGGRKTVHAARRERKLICETGDWLVALVLQGVCQKKVHKINSNCSLISCVPGNRFVFFYIFWLLKTNNQAQVNRALRSTEAKRKRSGRCHLVPVNGQ